MGLGGPAAYLCEVTNRQEAVEALQWAAGKALPVLMIGIGSNIVWRDEGFSGLVIVNKIMGFELYEEDELNVYLTIGAGENWDGVVARSVEAGLTGIEALSLVPGTTGATPVQNVGAYGQEVSQTITALEVYDTQAGAVITLAGADCGFGYRTSRFKTTDRGRFYILGVTFHLFKSNPMPPFYPAVQSYFDIHGITEYTPAALRQAVIAVRRAKLPDPAEVRNNGSFFANPVIGADVAAEIKMTYQNLPSWPQPDGRVKISAAWLIEQAGFKGVHDEETGMATWFFQPLVLVNEKARSTADLLAFKQKIVDAVQQKFGVTLEQEPELLPTA